jgi:hypothetical protein
MLFFAAVAAMAVAANAQSLRISNAVLGSNTPGAEQVIQLGPGGSHGVHVQNVHPHRVVSINKPVEYTRTVVAPQTYTVSSPQTYTIAAPQTYTIAAPQTYSVAQPIAHKLVHVAEPTVYKRIVSQPIVKVQTLANPNFVAHHQPIVSHHQPIVSHHQPIVKVSPLKVQEEHYEIQPYAFGFDSTDEFGAKHTRQENKDANGVVTGQYSLSGPDGMARVVSYVADSEGFRASVKTNEIGTLTSNPAGVQIESSATVPARR